MGQKINPIGFRLGVNRDWNSRWFARGRNFPTMLNEDLKVRDFLREKLAHAAVSKVIIERPAKDARITIHSARPGVVIGKKGEDIENLKAQLRRLLGVQMVHVNIEEVRKPETDAQLIADSIAQQLEKRIMFRRAMKRAMQNAMRLGALGIKIMSAGRLNGIEIARTEWYREGRVPLHTLRADIDYGFSEAKTTYGVIGIKVWVYKGEVLGKHEQPAVAAPAEEEAAAARRVRRGPPRSAPAPAPAPALAAAPAPAAAPAAPAAPAKAEAAPAAEEKAKPTRARAKKPEGAAAAKAAPAAKPAAAAPKKPAAKRVVKKSGGGGDASTS
jgi:small subunit ribosomal protein S3